MKVVLYQPQIPQNTGNIVRTCAVTGSSLLLVGPLGFSLQDRWLKRAGLDYWEGIDMQTTDDLEKELEAFEGSFYFFSSHAKIRYTDAVYSPDSWLIFGSETSGLPRAWHEKWPESFLTIPMKPEVRCLNLATSVGIVVYEAWRQQNFR